MKKCPKCEKNCDEKIIYVNGEPILHKYCIFCGYDNLKQQTIISDKTILKKEQ